MRKDGWSSAIGGHIQMLRDNATLCGTVRSPSPQRGCNVHLLDTAHQKERYSGSSQTIRGGMLMHTYGVQRDLACVAGVLYNEKRFPGQTAPEGADEMMMLNLCRKAFFVSQTGFHHHGF